MKNCKAIVCSLLAAFAASTASAALQNAITIPWEGDVTKFHTAVAGQQIILKGVLEATNPSVSFASYGVPQTVTFTTLDTSCGGAGTYTFLINGVAVATSVPPGNCSCGPGGETISISGSTLSNAWIAASPAIVEVQYSGGYYVSWVQAYLDWGGGTNYTDCMYVAEGSACGNYNLCSGYSSSSFDVTLDVANIVNANPTSVQYQWNPGDGSAFSALTAASVTPGTPMPVSLNYTYSGSPGTPYVAWLIASDGTTTISNRYLVMLQPAGLDANINIGIDNGLWWLYQNATFSDGVHGNFLTYDGSPCVALTGYSGQVHAGPTASMVQAFEINGSLQTGNWNQDPYAQAVAYGLNWILKGYYISESYPMLDAINITSGGTTSEGNPDVDGSGIGIEVNDGYSLYRPIYQGGQVVDALVASGTPNASTGRQFVNGYTALYKDVVQEMLDQYAWGQYTGAGSFNVLTYNPPWDLTTKGTPTSLTFEMTDGTYYPGYVPGTYTFNINGVTVGTTNEINEEGSYYCYPGVHAFTITGATLSDAWNNGGPPTIEVIYSGGGFVSEVDWVLDFSGTFYTNNIFLAQNHNVANVGYICDGNTSSYFDEVQDLGDLPQPPTTAAEYGVLGGWRYTWGQAPDNSTSQWAAIGAIAAEQPPWNCVIPSFETNYDNNWCWYSYADQNSTWGKFGYTSSASLGYPNPPSSSTTPSGLVQLNNDGITTNDYRWMKCEAYFQDNWDTGENFLNYGLVNFYSLYSFTKAQRTALPNPVVYFPDGFDWYRGNSSHTGLATAVSQQLVNNSYWQTTYWEGSQLATAWAVIVLKPNLFSAGPVACYSANPNPGFANVGISFDPGCSTDPQPGGIANLTLFDWNWGDGTPDTTTTSPTVVQHAFSCATLPCSYQVTLTVYDNGNPQLSASAQQEINITQPPHPPVAVPGGPYIVSLCPSDCLTLNGSRSYSPDQGLSQANCNTCPPDQLTAYGWALQGAPYVYTDSTDTNVDLGSDFTAYFPVANTYNIGLQVTDDASQSFPQGSPTNLTGTAFTTVTVYSAGPCQVTAAPGCQSVAVSWNDIGASSYTVISSTTGPNSGFTEAAMVGSGVTTSTIGASLNEVQWIRVQGVTSGGITMSGAIKVTNTFQDCVCITDLSIQSKATLVELDWPLVNGATSYNVYRSTGSTFSMIPQNRVATGVGTSGHGVYVDGDLINGRRYYYKISSVAGEVEQCRSIEVSAVPAATIR